MEASTSRPGRGPIVLVAVAREVACSLPLVQRVLLEDDGWLQPLADVAEREGEVVLATVRSTSTSPSVHRRVRVRLAGWRQRDRSVVVSISWQADNGAPGRHILDADLELVPLDDGGCRLVLSASYLALSGSAGDRLDYLAIHDAAEVATVSFLEGIAVALEKRPG